MKSFTLTENDAPQRLDRLCRKLMPSASLSLIFKLIRAGKIRVNDQKFESNHRVSVGDQLTIRVQDDEWSKLSHAVSTSKSALPSAFDSKSILFEDAHMLVVNKAPGVNVHPGEHKTSEVSLIQSVQDYLWKKLNSLTFKPSLVHRLDRDTSGALIIAKTKGALLTLLDDLQAHHIEKTYLTVVVGCPSVLSGTVRKKLLRKSDDERSDKAKVVIDEKNGQSAVTHYKVLARWILGNYSLIECRIETGRMHQIRVHMASLGCPVLGDRLYGNPWENAYALREYAVSRQLLHAWKLTLKHPIQRGRTVNLSARIASDMLPFCDVLTSLPHETVSDTILS